VDDAAWNKYICDTIDECILYYYSDTWFVVSSESVLMEIVGESWPRRTFWVKG
jgi:hypothetical protein